MTQLTTGTKVVLVVLVAFAVLFYTGLGLGLMGEGSGPANLDWIATISGALTPRLDFNALQGSCIDRAARGFVVERKTVCQVSIPGVSRGTRRITLSLAEGTRAEGHYQAPAQHQKIDEQDETADQVVSLEPDRSLAVVILKEGGSLSLTCDAPEKTRCRVAAR